MITNSSAKKQIYIFPETYYLVTTLYYLLSISYFGYAFGAIALFKEDGALYGVMAGIIGAVSLALTKVFEHGLRSAVMWETRAKSEEVLRDTLMGVGAVLILTAPLLAKIGLSGSTAFLGYSIDKFILLHTLSVFILIGIMLKALKRANEEVLKEYENKPIAFPVFKISNSIRK